MLCEAQKKMLVEFMNENEKLRSGKFTSNFSYKTAQELWINITNQLNSVPNGVEKDWKKWRKTWQDIKKNAKAKNAEIKKYSTKTGGGPSCPKTLNTLETEVLDMLFPVQTNGHGIGETHIDFLFTDELNSANEDSLPSTENHQAEEGSRNVVKLIIPATHSTEIDTSKERDNFVTVDNDHNYNLVYPSSTKCRMRRPPKKINKTSHLQTSIQLSQIHLKSIDERNNILSEYYTNKILIKNRESRTKLRMHRDNTIWWRNLRH